MEQYWKAVGGILVSLVLWISLQKQEKDLSLLLSIGVCVLSTMVLLFFLEPVVSFLQELSNLGQIQDGLLGSLLRILGIGLTGEITAMLCTDGGNSVMARIVGLLTAGAMLLLSLPMIRSLLTLIQEILMVL